jgi:hypothetical protein
MSDEPFGPSIVSSLSDKDRRAFRFFSTWVAFLVLGGLLSLALLASYCLREPNFRLSVAIFWGGITVFVMLNGLSRLARHQAQILVKASRQAPDPQSGRPPISS